MSHCASIKRVTYKCVYESGIFGTFELKSYKIVMRYLGIGPIHAVISRRTCSLYRHIVLTGCVHIQGNSIEPAAF
jgi:hypothetical protein